MKLDYGAKASRTDLEYGVAGPLMAECVGPNNSHCHAPD